MFWPGLATNDSGHRLCLAWSLLHGRDSGPVVMPESVFQQVFPPAMSLVAAALRWLTGTWGVMTFVGAWWFFASVGMLSIVTLGRKLGIAIWLLIAITPLVWNHAIAMLPDAWVAAALCTMLAVFLSHSAVSETHHRVLGRVARVRPLSTKFSWIAIVVSSIVFFTFRHNSITVLPLLLVLGVLWVLQYSPFDRECEFTRRNRTITWTIAALMLGVVSAQLLPRFAQRVLGWRQADVPATIMAWEHIGMLKLAGDRTDELAAVHSLDHVCANQPPNATRFSLDRFNWVAFNSMVYGDGAPLPAKSIRDDGRATRKAFWHFVQAEPLLYAKAKLRIWASVIGMRHDGPLVVITVNPPKWTEQYGVNLSLTNPLFTGVDFTALDRSTRAFMMPWMPYTWFSIGAISLIIAAVRHRTNAKIPLLPPMVLFLAAAMYYAGFLVISPGFEWRYFLPSFVLLILSTASSWRSVLTR